MKKSITILFLFFAIITTAQQVYPLKETYDQILELRQGSCPYEHQSFRLVGTLTSEGW